MPCAKNFQMKINKESENLQYHQRKDKITLLLLKILAVLGAIEIISQLFGIHSN